MSERALQRIEAVVIGGSAGALDALAAILPALPVTSTLPFLIVLHVPPYQRSYLVDVLGARCRLPVREGEDKEPLTSGTVYVAPPNYHLLVERRRTLALSADDPIHFSRPAIDALFESAADAFGPALLGVVLSGANEDGARGLARIASAGGTAVVQAPDSAVAREMPAAAIARTGSPRVLTPAGIGELLARLAPSGVARMEAS